MKLVFSNPPDAGFEALLAAQKYERLWQAHQEAALASLRLHTGLEFPDIDMPAETHGTDGHNHSGDTDMPMRLCFRNDIHDYTETDMIGTLLHELAHRLIMEHGLRSPEQNYSYKRVLRSHKWIYLFLYDVFVDVLGPDVANEKVQDELTISAAYCNAWMWALSKKTYDKRQQSWKRVYARYGTATA